MGVITETFCTFDDGFQCLVSEVKRLPRVLATSVKGTKGLKFSSCGKKIVSTSSKGFSNYCARFKGYFSGIIKFCRVRLEIIMGVARESIFCCL